MALSYNQGGAVWKEVEDAPPALSQGVSRKGTVKRFSTNRNGIYPEEPLLSSEAKIPNWRGESTVARR